MHDSRIINKLLERDTALCKSPDSVLCLPVVLLHHIAKVATEAQIKADRAALKLEHKPFRIASGQPPALAKMDSMFLVRGILIPRRGEGRWYEVRG